MKLNYKKLSKYMLTAALAVSVSSCEIFDLDINDDPNNPAEAAPRLLLPNIIYSASNTFAGGLNNAAHGFVGVTTSFDDFDLTNASFNGTWNALYTGPLKDLDGIIERSEDSPHYLGIAQVLKAYYFSLMVDIWGDVPYSEAFRGDAGSPIVFPVYDDDAAIYADLLRLLDEAVANFDRTSPVSVQGDPIYGGDVDQWKKVAKSLKLRLLIQTRKVNNNAATEINSLLSDGDLITSASDDFIFQFGKSQAPEFRHPWYQDAYTIGENAFSYISHQFMVEMLDNQDPRLPFYLKRQTETILNQDDPTDKQTTPCSQLTNCVYSYLVLNPNIIDRLYTDKGLSFGADEEAYLAGFFGRDRSDPSGLPLDGSLRTAPGVYPVGGLYDDEAELIGSNEGTGAGLFPMITSWMVKFYQVEAALTLGTAGDPRALFEEAIRDQMNKVVSFGLANDPDAELPDAESVDAYVKNWLERYDAAASNENKLAVVLKQAWFSNFGNGFESWNAFRRTGYPNDLQQPIQRVRQFALRIPYAQDDLTLNQNSGAAADVAFDRDPIFWDVLSFQF
jgi:hypothetical protein